METIRPTSGMILTENTRFEPGVYILKEGITIAADNITLDGAGAHLVGINHKGVGLKLHGVQDVKIKNLQLSGFYHGIRATDCQSLTITHCIITDTLEFNPDIEGVNIWREPVRAYSGGILLEGVSKSRIIENDLSHQMNGLMMYYCRELEIAGNLAGRNSCFGFILYESSYCTLTDNMADYCGRFPIKPTAQAGQHDSDSAGFLLLHNANHNTFSRNNSRMSANGFLISGLTPEQQWVPCNDNRFEMCDGSHNLYCGFSVSHSQRNVFTKNQANHSNNGFFFSYCRDMELNGNSVQGNHRAGIAAENGVRCQVENNTIQDNHFGILLWSKPDPDILNILPENETSKFWVIQKNSIHRNNTGLRIAANQDQGILSWKALQSESPETYLRPHDHEIRLNDISGNRVGIQTVHCDRTVIQDNSFSLNLAGDIKS